MVVNVFYTLFNTTRRSCNQWKFIQLQRIAKCANSMVRCNCISWSLLITEGCSSVICKDNKRIGKGNQTKRITRNVDNPSRKIFLKGLYLTLRKWYLILVQQSRLRKQYLVWVIILYTTTPQQTVCLLVRITISNVRKLPSYIANLFKTLSHPPYLDNSHMYNCKLTPEIRLCFRGLPI